MQYSEEEKAMWINDWQESGKSAWAYAKENSLNTRTFSKWAKKAGEATPSFVEIPLQVLPTQQQYNREILIEKGDVKIHIPVFLSSAELRAVMEGLGRVL